MADPIEHSDSSSDLLQQVAAARALVTEAKDTLQRQTAYIQVLRQALRITAGHLDHALAELAKANARADAAQAQQTYWERQAQR